MKKLKFKMILIVFAILAIAGCQPRPEDCQTKDAGLFISVSVVPKSFGGDTKCLVTTTVGNYVIYGTVSGDINSPVVLKTKTGGDSWYLLIGDSKYGHRIIGY